MEYGCLTAEGGTYTNLRLGPNIDFIIETIKIVNLYDTWLNEMEECRRLPKEAKDPMADDWNIVPGVTPPNPLESRDRNDFRNYEAYTLQQKNAQRTTPAPQTAR